MLAITIVCAPRSPEVVDAAVIFGALMGAIVWNLITWWLGIPSSSSHALIGGLASSGKVSVLRPLQSFFRPATTRI
jgi:phosphate/sulfate permease